jgi:nucleotide-binding universal stress UspA family protein
MTEQYGRSAERPRRILAPLDGSELAERALPYAEDLARRVGSELVLVRAAMLFPFQKTHLSEPARERVEEAEGYLEGVARTLRGRGLEVRTVAPYTWPEVEIAAEARRQEADLIVMSTHGRGGLGRWVYGSVAERVVAESPVPVMLVRAWKGQSGPIWHGEHRCILVPLDGSELAEAALPVARALVDALHGRLVLLRVEPFASWDSPVIASIGPGDESTGPTAVPDWDDEQERLRTEALEYLSRLRGDSEVRAELRSGFPVEAILDAAREHGAALVVMTTHGRTGPGGFPLGSVADSVLRQGSMPVVLVGPGSAPDGHAQSEAAGESASKSADGERP